MPGITSYPTTPAKGFAGQIADEAPRYVASAINKVGAPIAFGIAMKKGTNDDEAVLLAATGDKLAGISVHRHDVNTIGSSAWASDKGIPDGDRFDLLRDGVVYVKVEEAVVQYDNAFVRFASGAGGTVLGSFRKSADTATARAVAGAYFLASGAAGAIVPLYFNFSTANG
jgi:hypothetical protein